MRKRVVTRTIETSTVTVICVDVETCEVIKKVITIQGDARNNAEKSLKVIKKLHEKGSLKVVSIDEIEVNTDLYEMDEIYFLEHATKVEGGR